MVHAIGPVFLGRGKEMAKSDIKDFVCKPFCSFYREGAKEELICNGARLLEILIKRGILSPETIEEVASGLRFARGEYPALDYSVCRQCPFFANDCDFCSENPPLNAKPCGGYILLALLATKGVISMESLKEVVSE
jgi:hypothetical protein